MTHPTKRLPASRSKGRTAPPGTPSRKPPAPKPDPAPISTSQLEEIQAKLDQILDILAHLKLRKIKLAFEDPQDHSIRLLDPDEVVYILTSREDQGRRGNASSTETPDSGSSAGGDDSLTVYTTTGQTYRSYATLGDFRAKLQAYPGFVTTHRSYLVNLDHAVRVEITPSGRKVYFAGVDLPAEVSRDNVREVDQYLGL